MINKCFINIVPKLWGAEGWITNDGDRCYKILYVVPGYICSLHRHLVKSETFTVLEGELYLEYRKGEKCFRRILKQDESFFIKVGTPHRFSAILKDTKVLEKSTLHSDEDTDRLCDSRIWTFADLQDISDSCYPELLDDRETELFGKLLEIKRGLKDE